MQREVDRKVFAVRGKLRKTKANPTGKAAEKVKALQDELASLYETKQKLVDESLALVEKRDTFTESCPSCAREVASTVETTTDSRTPASSK